MGIRLSRNTFRLYFDYFWRVRERFDPQHACDGVSAVLIEPVKYIGPAPGERRGPSSECAGVESTGKLCEETLNTHWSIRCADALPGSLNTPGPRVRSKKYRTFWYQVEPIWTMRCGQLYRGRCRKNKLSMMTGKAANTNSLPR
jgi:hypothetical protein